MFSAQVNEQLWSLEGPSCVLILLVSLVTILVSLILLSSLLLAFPVHFSVLLVVPYGCIQIVKISGVLPLIR